jgi:hypothetical protein
METPPVSYSIHISSLVDQSFNKDKLGVDSETVWR